MRSLVAAETLPPSLPPVWTLCLRTQLLTVMQMLLKFKERLPSAQTDNPLCPAWRSGCQSSSVRAWPASLKCCDPNLSPRLLLSPVCANEPHSSEARGRGAKKGHLKKGSICLELKENHLSLQDETAPGWDWAPNGLKPQAVKFRRERWWNKRSL